MGENFDYEEEFDGSIINDYQEDDELETNYQNDTEEELSLDDYLAELNSGKGF